MYLFNILQRVMPVAGWGKFEIYFWAPVRLASAIFCDEIAARAIGVFLSIEYVLYILYII